MPEESAMHPLPQGERGSEYAAALIVSRKPLWSARFGATGVLMPSTYLDSAVFRDIFTTPAMRQVWSDENRVQKYLDFEKALAVAQAKLKIIPQEACDEIVKHCDVKDYDMAKLKEATERIGYPVLPVVQQLVKL